MDEWDEMMSELGGSDEEPSAYDEMSEEDRKLVNSGILAATEALERVVKMPLNKVTKYVIAVEKVESDPELLLFSTKIGKLKLSSTSFTQLIASILSAFDDDGKQLTTETST
jgi:hypothetical protein